MCLPTHPVKTVGDGVDLPAALAAAAAAGASAPIAAAGKARSGANENARRVRFGLCPTRLEEGAGRAPSPPSPLNQLSDWTDVWYGARDLGGFRDEAREHCRAMRVRLNTVPSVVVLPDDSGSSDEEYGSDASSSSSSSTSSSSGRPSSPPAAVTAEPLLAATDQCRGLEARCCLERQRRKYLTNKCIVKAQSHLSPDQLALLSQKCTAWASELAAREGARDYFRAYAKRRAPEEEEGATASSPSPSSEEDGRRVRPRTA